MTEHPLTSMLRAPDELVVASYRFSGVRHFGPYFAWKLMVDLLPDDPELTAGLRKLMEAKDCFVRSALTADRGDPQEPRAAEVSRPHAEQAEIRPDQ
jgi:hypothetical protein